MPSKTFTLPKRSPSPKLYFFHGFSGSPEDWSGVIENLPGCTCQALTYPFDLPSDGILIGYSMGGRIALNSPRPKIIISGHPGLQTPEEREARAAQERAWIDKLHKATISEFFDTWYQQPIFTSLKAHPTFPAILQRRLKQNAQVLIDQIEKHSLALPSPAPRNTVFLHGALDATYRELYLKLRIPSHEIPQAGHACHLENPLATARQIKILIDSF